MEWSSYEEAVVAEHTLRSNRIDRLSMIASVSLLLTAVWILWPLLQSTLEGNGGILSGFGTTVILILWGMILQDVPIDDPKARTRIATAATFGFPILSVTGAMTLSSSMEAVIAGGCILIAASYCFQISHYYLTGPLDVLRYRSVVTFIGTGTAATLFFTTTTVKPEFGIGIIAPVLLVICVIDGARSWLTGDEHKELRKEFKRRLNTLEIRVLELKAQGAAIAQAGSLVTTAGEEGHVDPHLGMKLLNDAEEVMERALSLSEDVEIIQNDALDFLQRAEHIAPTAVKPRKAFEMGERELKLGSLREAEGLFRQSKKRSLEIIEWWQKAQQAITEAESLLQQSKGVGVEHLRDLLSDAKTKLHAEQPLKAYEFACVIPDQIKADEGAMERARESLENARNVLLQSDGIGIEDEMNDRLHQAKQALEEGLASQVIGLSDGIVRTIEREREAMDYTRRAMKQKKKLLKNVEGTTRESEWKKRIQDIEAMMKDSRWTKAEELLQGLTKDLDSNVQEREEAKKLFEFIVEEWNVLRNQCEASGIGVQDEQRKSCEAEISVARQHVEDGNVKDVLASLATCDELMEKIRRRV